MPHKRRILIGAIGFCLISMGLLYVVTYIYTTGMYTPLGATDYDLRDTAWSGDGRKLRFRAEFPIGMEYELDISRDSLKSVGYPDTERLSDSSDYEAIEKQFGLQNVRNVQFSPDQKYLAVVVYNEPSRLKAPTEHLYVFDVNTKQIRFKADRTRLIRMIKVTAFNQPTSLVNFEIAAWVMIALGFVLMGTQLIGLKNRLLLVLFIPVFVFFYCCCGFGYIFTWLPP